MKKLLRLALIFFGMTPSLVLEAATNVNATNNSSWGANIGWINWQGDGTNGGIIGEYVLGGFIYGSNVGWINLGSYNPANHIQYQNNSATDFGVNFTRNGNTASLRGFAYGANIGWINFEDTGNPTIDLTTRQLHGYAYGANVGWINLGELGVTLKADSIAPGIDTDNNGLADAFETINFGQLGVNPNADPDGDGSTNLQEYQAGTNPLFPDVRLLNISTRLQVLKGDNVLIGGFIVGGAQPKTVAVRAIAPSLTPFGVQGALDNPILELHRSSDNSLVSMNDNWKDAPNASDIMTRGLAPADDRESVILDTLAPGGYTAIVRGVSDGTGVALVEAYDLDQTVAAKLGNISTRGFVGIDDNVMIGGFIVNGTGTGSPRVVVRALGPTLTSFGVPGAIADPTLDLLDSNGVVLASNDNWQDSQAAEISATGLQPPDTHEPAIVRNVAPGRYTAIVRGSGGATGVSLVEVYNVVQ